MRKQFCAALIVSVVFAASVFGAERRIQLKWEELAGIVQGKKIQMILCNGEEVEGKVKSVEPQALQITVPRTGNREKGLVSIPRAEVSVIRVEGRSGPWRAVSTAIGAGTGTLFGVGAYQYANNEGGADGRTAAFAAGLIGGGAGLGYLFGRSLDRHAFVVSIID